MDPSNKHIIFFSIYLTQKLFVFIPLQHSMCLENRDFCRSQ